MAEKHATGSISDAIIHEASERFARNEATDADRIILIQDRQCGKLDRISDVTDTFLEDRKKLLWILPVIVALGNGGDIISALSALLG